MTANTARAIAEARFAAAIARYNELFPAHEGDEPEDITVEDTPEQAAASRELQAARAGMIPFWREDRAARGPLVGMTPCIDQN